MFVTPVELCKFEDSEVRNEVLRTAEKAGHTIRNNKKHYALVGEAVMLAMRTNVNMNK